MQYHILHRLELTTHVEITSVGVTIDVTSDTRNCVFQNLFSEILMGYFLHRLFLANDVEWILLH